MTLQASGTITLAQIQAEFGGANPIYLGEYYRGGAYVPNTTLNLAVPTNGAIDLADFYGTSGGVQSNITVTCGSYSDGGKNSSLYSGYNAVTGYGSRSPTTFNGVLIYGINTYGYISYNQQVWFQNNLVGNPPFSSLTINGTTFNQANAVTPAGTFSTSHLALGHTRWEWTGATPMPTTGTIVATLST
jgi:hypothetical protein